MIIFLKNILRNFLDLLGLGSLLRKVYTKIRNIPETIYFLFTKRPDIKDNIILAGAGRSGTTWLSTMLVQGRDIQEIFEPLLPTMNKEVAKITNWKGTSFRNKGWYLRSSEKNGDWLIILDKILTGKYRNYWTDMFKTTNKPSRYLIKEIHMNMMLGYVHNNFSSRIIFLIRNPLSVISSRIEHGWDCDLNELWCQQSLVDDFLYNIPKDEVDNVNSLPVKHAIWWCVENYVAIRQLQTIQHFFVVYEELQMNEEKVFNSVNKWLELDTRINDSIIYPRTGTTKSKKNCITENEKFEIDRWIKKFHLNIYSNNRPLYTSSVNGAKNIKLENI